MGARRVGTLAIAVVIACGGPQVRTSATETDPEITLLSPGATPRARVRYAVSPTTERVEIKFKFRTETELTNTVLETGKLLADFPTIVLIARLRSSVAPQPGHVTISADFEDVRVLDDVVDPALHQRVTEGVERLRTWKGHWTLAPSGRTTDVVIEPPKDAAMAPQMPALVEAIGDTAVRFPDSDIGVGATWQVKSRQSRSGAAWQRTTTYRLRELQGSIVSLDVETVMHAPSQVLGVEPATTTRLTSGESEITSTVTVRLDGLVPLGDSRASSEVNLSMVRGRLRLTSSIRTEILSSLRSLPIE